jgi:hypothetical protein
MKYVDQTSIVGRQTRLIQSGNITNNPQKSRWDYRGVREKRYTYTRWSSGFVELYDRKRDPAQLLNVAKDRAYHDVRREMRKRYRTLRNCVGAADCYRYFGKPPKIGHR